MADTLFAVLIQIDADALLLPNAAVSEVTAMDRFEPAEKGAPPWLAGWHTTAERRIPVLSFEGLCGQAQPQSHKRQRVVIVNPVGQRVHGGAFALLAQGHPHLLTLKREAIAAIPLRPADREEMTLSRVRVAGQEAVIPDLERIESELASLA
jgi:chemosensory pili system protein ChpC